MIAKDNQYLYAGMYKDVAPLNNFSPCPSQQIRGIKPMLFQCWASVEDGGSTLKHHWGMSRVFWDVEGGKYNLKDAAGL